MRCTSPDGKHNTIISRIEQSHEAPRAADVGDGVYPSCDTRTYVMLKRATKRDQTIVRGTYFEEFHTESKHFHSTEDAIQRPIPFPR